MGGPARVGQLAHAFGHINSAQAGHLNVGEDQVEVRFHQLGEAAGPVFGFFQLHAPGLQHHAGHRAVDFVVFDEQHPRA